MQCVGHSQLWLLPGEFSSRVKNCAGVGFISGRSTRLNDEITFRCSPQLSFLGSEIIGSSRLRKWEENYQLKSTAGQKVAPAVHASLMVEPVVWVIRTVVYYVLLETGIAGGRQLHTSDSKDKEPKVQGLVRWFQNHLGVDEEQKRNKEHAKLRSKWHASTKGTLVRRYRVPSKAGGKKLLYAIASLLADDDTFRDVATHKGCQVRRENAHAESVCCHNVRALFDELPTPHLVVEITVFPAGPITAAHYDKADKIEKVLKTGIAI